MAGAIWIPHFSRARPFFVEEREVAEDGCGG